MTPTSVMGRQFYLSRLEKVLTEFHDGARGVRIQLMGMLFSVELYPRINIPDTLPQAEGDQESPN